MRRRRERDDRGTALTYQVASRLLAYPDEEVLATLPTLVAALPVVPEPARSHLRPLLDHLTAADPAAVTADYVETFDLRRRCCLFLTYFAHGDTRKRGPALLRFTQTYQRAGLVLHADELPDHLCVVLEFAATADLDEGRRLLLEHRAGLELLRLSLVDSASPWAGAVAAVTSTLPALRGDEREAVARLAAEGPPEEEVGLEAYGPPATVGAPS